MIKDIFTGMLIIVFVAIQPIDAARLAFAPSCRASELPEKHSVEKFEKKGPAGTADAREASSTGSLKAAKETYEKAVRYHLKKDYEHAVAEYLVAASLEPEHPIILEQLGRAYYELWKTDEAAAVLGKAVKLDYSNPGPHFLLGKVYRQQKEYERAIIELDKYLQLAPDGGYKWEAELLKKECEGLLLQR